MNTFSPILTCIKIFSKIIRVLKLCDCFHFFVEIFSNTRAPPFRPRNSHTSSTDNFTVEAAECKSELEERKLEGDNELSLLVAKKEEGSLLEAAGLGLVSQSSVGFHVRSHSSVEGDVHSQRGDIRRTLSWRIWFLALYVRSSTRS